MQYLLDTGILLRLVNRHAAMHQQVRRAVRLLKSRGDSTVTTYQNLCEFWNVCTRPLEARGGFGLSVEDAARRLRTIERITTLLPDSPDAYAHWKGLVLSLAIRGVQVHDAKLVALMTLSGVTHILTLNPRDFARFAGISAVTSEDLLAAPPPP